VIAQAAEVSNPKRIYFLQKEVRLLSASQLQSALQVLLTLELGLKQGAPEQITLQTKLIEIAHGFAPAHQAAAPVDTTSL
jgi:DNA polymerase-3 subunit delta